MKSLYPHQIEDAAFLARSAYAGNWSGMGSGKTLTALEALKLLGFDAMQQLERVAEHRVIIVCPPIAMTMWADNYIEHLSMPVQIVKTGKVKLQAEATAYVMSYEIAVKRVAELKQLSAQVLIMDESHAIKTPTAKRTGALIGRGGLCTTVARTWFMTGTPSTRYNDDMFTFLARACPERLLDKIGGSMDRDSFERFRLRYCITQLKKFSSYQRVATRVTVGNRNGEELNAMMFDGDDAPCVRRELKDVWAAMPPISVQRLGIPLDSSWELKELLKVMERKTLAQVQEGLRREPEANLARIRRMLGAAKVKAAAAEIADRVEAGNEPILVGCWHHLTIDGLVEALHERGIDCSSLDGRTSPRLRDSLQAEFNAGRLPVLVGQISAMGVAINLQGGHLCVVVEEDFSDAIMDQFYARLHRIGQENHVFVDVLDSGTKLEKAIRTINRNKARGHGTLMGQQNVA